MKIHYAPVAVMALFALAACGQGGGPAPAPGGGLTGDARTQFVDASTASCKAGATADPNNSRFSAETIATYCSCYSNKMADAISPSEMESLGADPAKAQATLQPRIDAAMAACRPAQ